MILKKKKLRHWLLNWNLIIVIIAITLILEMIVVLISFDLPKKGYTILGFSIAAAVAGIFAYYSHNKQRKVLLRIQGIEPLRFSQAGSYLNLVLTIIISGSIFTGISYLISEYAFSEPVPLYFSIPEIVLGVMITTTKNLTVHEILGKTLLIRVSFIELFIPIDNIQSIKADDKRLPEMPKDLHLPRRYRAVSSYFGKRVLIKLKKPQSLFFMGPRLTKKTDQIIFNVDEPERFVTAILKRKPSLKSKKVSQ
jgi:hypothetical protein